MFISRICAQIIVASNNTNAEYRARTVFYGIIEFFLNDHFSGIGAAVVCDAGDMINPAIERLIHYRIVGIHFAAVYDVCLRVLKINCHILDLRA